MKGYRFYLEYDSPVLKRKGTVKNPGPHTGNVIAIILRDDGYFEWQISFGVASTDAFTSVFSTPNSFVALSGVSFDYLQKQCRRIPEKLAREIHPRLFERLDEND